MSIAWGKEHIISTLLDGQEREPEESLQSSVRSVPRRWAQCLHTSPFTAWLRVP